MLSGYACLGAKKMANAPSLRRFFLLLVCFLLLGVCAGGEGKGGLRHPPGCLQRTCRNDLAFIANSE